ncbi:MAG TPA: hypothetical protein VKM93_11440 [Terriglobia bacterium]|nr:hypothetical protein [Terriglobia bacterium]
MATVPSERPVISVVVAIVSDTTDRPDTTHLEPCLAALVLHQPGAPSTEIIVPYHPAVAGIARVSQQYPDVRFLEVADLRTAAGLGGGSREHHDELRARGLAVARGDIVALIEDVGIPAPDWIARVLEAHRQPFAGVGGAIENGIDRPLNWAVYFCDFLRYQNPLPEGESAIASDANVSYKRTALESIRPVWEEFFHESSVNNALRSRGEKLALAPGVVLYQHRQGLRLGGALKERYVWGRSYAATRARLAGTPKRAFWAVFTPALPALMLARMTLMVWKKRRTRGAFLKALPLVAALVTSWSGGELVGYVTGRANAAGSQAAEAIARGSQAK